MIQPIKIEDFDEYIRQGEPDKKEKAYIWQTAIGLQAVDGLSTSEYLKEAAKRNIEGEITVDEVGRLIKSYYQSKTQREPDDDEKEEADHAAANISKILSARTLDFSTAGYVSLHRRIFEGVFKHAGKIRDYDITKKEWVLNGGTVNYLNSEDLRRALDYDIEQEREFSYKGLSTDEMIAHITRFVSGIWQIHAFGEGNTRTTAVFTIQYLRSIGFDINNDLFAKHSWYFRNALVRANYKNARLGIDYSPIYLERFFRNLLLGEEHDLRNRIMHIDWEKVGAEEQFQSANHEVKSAKVGEELPPKCKNCTLEEVAVLRIVQKSPSATQKEIAAEIGKSERTVKSITIALQEKNILQRVMASVMDIGVLLKINNYISSVFLRKLKWREIAKSARKWC